VVNVSTSKSRETQYVNSDRDLCTDHYQTLLPPPPSAQLFREQTEEDLARAALEQHANAIRYHEKKKYYEGEGDPTACPFAAELSRTYVFFQKVVVRWLETFAARFAR